MTTNERVGYCSCFRFLVVGVGGLSILDVYTHTRVVKHTRQRSLFIIIIKYSQPNILKNMLFYFPSLHNKSCTFNGRKNSEQNKNKNIGIQQAKTN